ncbi:hypothetical protein [Streptomyces sp. NPDC057496]|uniref:hypothetical protein n=1 Tax=Streptomyces sp. NPDC057496 TaxID=3346149 RepID=UPI00367853B0
MADTEEVRAPSVSTGFIVGMLVGTSAGLVLGQSVLDNPALGLTLGSGAGGVLGITFAMARHSRRQSP